MSSLYQRAGQMIANWCGEDACAHTDPYVFAHQIVEMVVDEIRENGFPSLDQVAAHDESACE